MFWPTLTHYGWAVSIRTAGQFVALQVDSFHHNGWRYWVRIRTLRGFPSNEPGSWTLTPARSFTVFGLPVAQVRLFIDPDRELGASYTAVIEKRSLEQVNRQLEFAGNLGRIGQLSADQPGQHIELTCSVVTGAG